MHGYGNILETASFISDRDDYASPGLLGPEILCARAKTFFRIQNKIKKIFSDVFK